uniref:ODAD1 central coiled coil region domain-containing protein n=1 Tax=Lotharella globosa TaxID=91324 RepID=A0A7S3Z0P3_9EUKA|mmetsp:Transcript_9102/g.17813  ORF Transcript_9102/g.17813 Transcript_9102/m.17813 type:complete len:426 (+) Transcript_9102:94-1371(+)
MESAQKGGMSKEETLRRLQEEAEEYQRKIMAEQERVAKCEEELDVQTELLEEYDLSRKRANFRNGNPREHRELRTLENDLSKAVARLAEANEHNKMLRNRIDHYRKEKESFDTVYRKLKRDVHRKKRALTKSRASAEEHTSAADALQSELQSVEAKLQAKKGEYKETVAALKRKIASKHDSDGQKSKPKTYEEAFQNIQMKMGDDDLSSIIKKFIAHEDHRLVAENAEKELAKKRIEIARLQQHGASGTSKHRAILDGLDAKLVKAGALRESYQAKYQVVHTSIESLVQGINEIVRLLHRNRRESKRGGDSGEESKVCVNVSNIMKYLEMIEGEINTLIEGFAEDDVSNHHASPSHNITAGPASDEHEDHKSGYHLQQSPERPTRCTIAAAASADDDEDEDGEWEMPLSIEELRARVMAQRKSSK